MMIRQVLIIFIGFAGGLAVGAGFVAFLTVLGIIPRLTQLTKTMRFIHHYEWAVVVGAVVACWIDFQHLIFNVYKVLTIPLGLASGIFVGMLAAALTEVLNVFPILAKRIHIDDKIIMLLMAIVLGKISGSLFQWIIFVDL